MLAAAAVILRDRGGNLTLIHPQQSVLRMLTTMGAEQMLTIRRQTAAFAGPASQAEASRS
jgi:tRNA1(Val) A37 N6-methylase TrmN6